MRRKLTAWLLALVMALTLVGCADDVTVIGVTTGGDQEPQQQQQDVLPDDTQPSGAPEADDSSADTITVYLLVLQETYSADGETLTMENGSYVPTAITFSLSTSSGPTPLEYWEPSDGSYSDDIRAKFPAAAAEEALNDQAYIDALRSACDEQAQKARTSTQG